MKSNATLDTSKYTRIKFDFWYQPKNYAVNEGFELWVKFNGAKITKAAEWKRGRNFKAKDIGNWIGAVAEIATDAKSKNIRLQFRGKGNTKKDLVFLDDLYIR